MQSFLIVGGNQKEREKRARKLAGDTHPVDIAILVPDPSITIEKIRELKQTLSFKPIKSKQEIAFIFEAQKMTIAAQNALLKTLEEPPGESLLILTAPNSDLLLPTISSRCQIINLSAKSEIEFEKEEFLKNWETLKQLLNGGVGKKLLLSEGVAKNRQEGINWLKMQTVLWRAILLYTNDCAQILSTDFADSKTGYADKMHEISNVLSTKQIIGTLKNIEQTKKMLEGNVHVRLALDNLLLEYPTFSQPD